MKLKSYVLFSINQQEILEYISQIGLLQDR